MLLHTLSYQDYLWNMFKSWEAREFQEKKKQLMSF